MSQISAYIWGIRFGFKAGEALFPEKDRLDSDKLREYEIVTRNFNEKKDTFFRLCSKDFYFTMRDEQYRYYSLVMANHTDIAGRKAFLVLTLMCGRNKLITGDIIAALQNLKILYKTKNADNSIDRNLFTQDHVNQQITMLGTADAGSKTMPSNTLITFMEGNLHADYFNQIGGDEVYFIPEGSNSEMIANMGFQRTIKLEEEIQKTTERNKYKADFLALWQAKNEQDLNQLKELFSKCKDVLDPAIAKDFTDWEKNTNSNNRLNTAAAQIRTELEIAQKNNFSGDPTKCLELLSNNIQLGMFLNKEEQQQLEKWKQIYSQSAERNLVNQIEGEIAKAKRSDWRNDPAVVENLFSKLKSNNTVSNATRNDFRSWKDTFGKRRVADLKLEVVELAREIKKASRKQKLNNENAWEKKIRDFKSRASVLGDSSIASSEEFKFLSSDAWKPAKLPILKLAAAAVVLCIIGGVFYFLPKGQETNTELISEVDKLIEYGKNFYKVSNFDSATTYFDKALSKLDSLQEEQSYKAKVDTINIWLEKCKSNNDKLSKETNRLLESGKNLFTSGNEAYAKNEFQKALLKAKEADSLEKTSITKANIDTVKAWIAKCELAIKNGKNGQKETPPVVKKDNSAGGSPTKKDEEKKNENDADKYWAKFKSRITFTKNSKGETVGKFKGKKEEAENIIGIKNNGAPKKINDGLVRPENLENRIILDAVYNAANPK
jgi:hypothetical protein